MPYAGDQDMLGNKISGLSAYLRAFSEGPDIALAELQGKRDAESIRRQLSILIDNKRYTEGAELIEGLPPDPKWGDRAVVALVASDQAERAKQIIAWTKAHASITDWHRCIFAFLETIYGGVFSRRSRGHELRAEFLDDDDRRQLKDAVDVAGPIVRLVEAKERIDNELESLTLQFILHAEILLRDYGHLAAWSSWLSKRKPIPKMLGGLMLQKHIPASADLVARLRLEHPRNFDAQRLAILIDAEILGRPDDAFRAAMELTNEDLNTAQKAELARVLMEVGQAAGAENFSRLQEVAPKLVGPNDRLLKHINILSLLSADRLDEAVAALNDARDDDDPVWLQLYGHYLLATDHEQAALEQLTKAASLVPHPAILARVSALAFKLGRLQQTAGTLEQLVRLEPDNLSNVHNLALVYTRLESWPEAAKQYSRLRELDPSNETHVLNEATALARAGDWHASLKLYDRLCNPKNHEIDVRYVLARAGLLKSMGQARRGFTSLQEFRDRFWDDASFVSAYLDLSFAAEEEAQGQEALLQLRRLQALGKVGKDVLQEKTIDDLRQWINQERQNDELIAENLLSGKVPWLMADALRHRASYWGWKLRTQELTWLGDDPHYRALHCIYSTNAFTAAQQANGDLHLEDIVCPTPGTTVAIDLSSLITLHHLDLLPQCAAYFGRILYPSSYHTLRLHEGDKLLLHQPSRKRAHDAIKAAVDARHIRVGLGNDSIPFVNEHTLPEDQQHYYRIKDLLAVIAAEGVVRDSERRSIESVAHKDGGADATHPPLSLTQPILVDLTTLETLCQSGGLDAVLRSFRVHVTEGDYDSLIQNLRALEAQEEVRLAYSAMWESVRFDPRFVQALYTVPDTWKDSQLPERNDESLAAMFLAKHERVPLLADDRVCQTYLLNERRSPDGAFGTDALLDALARHGTISWDRAAEHYLALMRLRYRFIVPPAEVIVALAEQFKESLPGNQLRELARYVHDSLRDPGLFNGPEPTTPPSTMGSHLYVTWCTRLAEAVVHVWIHDAFPSESAKVFTHWITRECLPSPASNLRIAGRLMCYLTPRIVFTRALFELCKTSDYAVGDNCLRTIAEGLGVTHEEMFELAMGLIDAI